MSQARKKGSRTLLSRLSNMTMPTTMMTAITLRIKLSNVIFFCSITPAKLIKKEQNGIKIPRKMHVWRKTSCFCAFLRIFMLNFAP